MHASLFSIIPLLGIAAAICPGFNFGIGNVEDVGSGISRWTVYDSACNAHDGLVTTENPCDSGTFTCSPPPVFFTSYTDTFSGLGYQCRQDPNAGICGNDPISVCCRNDGN